MVRKTLKILGIRGIPAAHGGFESFAERLAKYLVERGWRVIVYCQEEGRGNRWSSEWQGVCLEHIPVTPSGALGTMAFDWASIVHASSYRGLVLTLGYNTAAFCIIYRLKGVANIINMDGIEWRRQKWGSLAKVWFWLNELAGSWIANHLVADHPQIKRHLIRRVPATKVSVIPYGADRITHANQKIVEAFGLLKHQYAIVIARAEPENSILEIVRAWSVRPRGIKLVVLGTYDLSNPYQYLVRDAASAEVVFLGAIYEKDIVQALRFFALFYIHGHTVGGTNPSLVEAMGAGNAVLAHDNPYNRWVAGVGALYFKNESDCEDKIGQLISHQNLLRMMRTASVRRQQSMFIWENILAMYEELLSQWT